MSWDPMRLHSTSVKGPRGLSLLAGSFCSMESIEARGGFCKQKLPNIGEKIWGAYER